MTEILNGKFIHHSKKKYRGIIYLRTSPSGKHYVGQTFDEAGRNYDWNRMADKYAGGKINRARKKYGPDKFTYKVLVTIVSDNYFKILTILDTLEIYYIKRYDSFNNGYNSTIGGRDALINPPLEESEIVQLTYEGEFVKHWFTIKEAAEHFNIKTCQIHKCCKKLVITVGKFRWMYLKDYENNKNDLLSYLPKSKKNLSKVIQLSLDGEFIKEWETATEASNTLKISIYHISACCNGKRRRAGNFRWMNSIDYNSCNGIVDKIDFSKTRRYINKIVQFDLDGNFIREWESIKPILEKYEITRKAIEGCCLGKIKTAVGYRWMYKKDYDKLENKKLDSIKILSQKRKIIQYTLNNEFIKIWDSLSQINKELGFNCDSISKACKGNKGNIYKSFIWKYKER